MYPCINVPKSPSGFAAISILQFELWHFKNYYVLITNTDKFMGSKNNICMWAFFRQRRINNLHKTWGSLTTTQSQTTTHLSTSCELVECRQLTKHATRVQSKVG